MKNKIMKCGCAPQGYVTHHGGLKLDPPLEACLIHDCYESMEDVPDLKGRTAKCAYFGKTKPRRRYANDECNYGCGGNPVCNCGNQPSDFGLAFFKYKSESSQDEFYCGCFGWD
jgi:hypothetical protein